MNKTLSILCFYGLIFSEQYKLKDLNQQSLDISKNRTCGTWQITDLIRGKKPQSIQELDITELGLSNNININLVLPTNYDDSLETNHFRFYYTLDQESTHAIDSVEYVIAMGDIFEQVWSFFIDTLNFLPPPGIDYLHNKYKIYIENINPNYFGLTYSINDESDNPGCESYIKMRNSYSGSVFSDKSEIENIKVTAVHEFFHAIQFGYNCWEDFWFMEATAVWSEDELYNNINDLYRYLAQWFSNPNTSIETEGYHMYGTFILFQYIDEHLGGPETIKNSWQYSNQLAIENDGVSIQAIDKALKDVNSSFDETYHRMRIANRILSSNENAGIYSYEEAEEYLDSAEVAYPPPQNSIIFKEGNHKIISSSLLNGYETSYYSLQLIDRATHHIAPVKIKFSPKTGDFMFTTIIQLDSIEWTIRSENELIIDPIIEYDWISFVVSAIGTDADNWDFSLIIQDGNTMDFTIYNPYPNPFNDQGIHFDLQVIKNQNLDIHIVDILGKRLWQTSYSIIDPQYIHFSWDGKNNKGNMVANGVYFILIKGRDHTKVKKFTLLK